MRANLLTPAIVLRARPFGESDKIVSFFTEHHGKVTGIAKGALRSRKRFVNSLETFSLINLTFYDRPRTHLAFVLAAELTRAPRMLLRDLQRIAYASYLVEITEGLIGERESNPAVFQHLKDALGYLEEKGASLRFLTAFELKLLTLAGYQPVWDHCKRCRREDSGAARWSWHFSPSDGGLLCDVCARSCRELLPLGKTSIDILKALQNGADSLPALALPHAVVSELRSVVQRFVQFQVDREIKSAPFLHQFSSV